MKKENDRVVEHEVVYRKQDGSLPPAIIVDIDGTIALINGRSPFDETKWHKDLPHIPIIELIQSAFMGWWGKTTRPPTLIFMTGREGGVKNELRISDWLDYHTPFKLNTAKLYTRTPGDYRGDTVVKKEMFEEHVEDQYNVLWVFEDRNKMVNFWRNEMHLPTLQVKDGDY